mmetsp:Transcript_100237/g.139308  ORF Transcript_100237/g.139308 Transcript_100237/m.139308 type:complete len:98 (-) Transcript_100237:240-533(-)
MGCGGSSRGMEPCDAAPVLFVPESLSMPPSRALPPDHTTHRRYVRKLNRYLIDVAENPDAFQRKVRGRREASVRELWQESSGCSLAVYGTWLCGNTA